MSKRPVTPFGVSDEKIDYEKLIRDFGCVSITDDILRRFEEVTGHTPHHWLRRKHYYAHRDFTRCLDLHAKGIPFYLYTGRGPSGGMHLGHLVPFMFAQYLQRVFKCPLVIQLTDDEKFLFRDDLTMDKVAGFMDDNCRDIIASGFDPERTFIFNNMGYIQTLYPVMVRIQKSLTMSQIKGCFGFAPSQNIGCWGFPPIQMAPAFDASFPGILSDAPKNSGPPVQCLVPCAIDQDPYFRMVRGEIGVPETVWSLRQVYLWSQGNRNENVYV